MSAAQTNINGDATALAQFHAQVLKTIGYAAVETIQAIKTQLNTDAAACASAMRFAGYADEQIALGLKNAYNLSHAQVTTAITGVGASLNTVMTTVVSGLTTGLTLSATRSSTSSAASESSPTAERRSQLGATSEPSVLQKCHGSLSAYVGPRASAVTWIFEMILEADVTTNPPSILFNPFVPPDLDSPYASLAYARQHEPVFFNPIVNMWMVTKYRDVMTILRNPQIYSSRAALQLPPTLSPAALELLRDSHLDEGMQVNEDPPAHTRKRAIASKAFVPTRIAAWEPRVRAIAQELLDEFVGKGEVEFVTRFAFPLPIRVICAIIGVPFHEIESLKRWSGDWMRLIAGQCPVEQQVECVGSAIKYHRHMTELVDEHRRHPKDDLTTDLINAQLDGSSLSTVEVATYLRGLLTAGFETTASLLGGTFIHLLQHPAQWQALLAEPQLIPDAIEETLRYDSPVVGMLRLTVCETKLGEVTLPAGALVLPLFGSANRDEEEFEHADRLDIKRPRAEREKMLAFGRGIHYCMGAALARLEARIALELFSALPNLRLREGQKFEYHPNLMLRGLKSLDLLWDPTAVQSATLKE